MNRIDGYYTGVDSSTMPWYGRYDKCDFISIQHDCLAIAGHDDLRFHIETVADDQPMVEELCEAQMKMSKNKYGNQRVLQKTILKFSSGATYISIEDAIEMENDIKFHQQLIIKRRSKSDASVKEMYLDPSWP